MFPILEAGPSLEGATLPAFVVARDGLYLRKRSLLGLSQTKVGRVAHLPEGKEFVDYARRNQVDHIVMGARSSSMLRRYLGSVSARVVAESDCTVTVVRAPDAPR